jgi:hypothetical protein
MKKTDSKKTDSKKPIQRNPTPFDQQAADLLCGSIATTTASLAKIVSDLRDEYQDFPCATIIYEWLHSCPEFALQYANARSSQSDLLFEEIVNLADDFDVNDDDNTKIQRAKLRLDARKFACSRLSPSKYGERLDITSKIKHELPCPISLAAWSNRDDVIEAELISNI